MKVLLRNLVMAMAMFNATASFASTEANDPYLIGTLNSKTGQTELTNTANNPAITTLIFKNTGTTDVTISHVELVVGSQIVYGTEGEMGFGVQAGSSLMVLFSNFNPVNVSTIKFLIEGKTESLEVYGLDRSGPVPGGFSGGN